MRGNLRENAVRSRLMEQGWLVASLRHVGGPGDLLAIKRGARNLLCEVKSTIGPYDHFSPKDRQAMLEAGERFDADVCLAWWPARGKLVYYHASVWPEARKAAA